MSSLSTSGVDADSSVVEGRVVETFLDFQKAHVGQVLEVPYEVTVGHSWRDIWQSAFYQHDRLYTSRTFAQRLGFQDTVMPFSMMLFHTGSMSHLDDELEVIDLGYYNAVYARPVYAGDTLTKTFVISGIRPTHDNETVVTIQCKLMNTVTHDVHFHVEKRLLYPRETSHAAHSRPPDNREVKLESAFLDRILANPGGLDCGSGSLIPLAAGELLIHGLARPLGLSNHMNLSTMARLTHPLVFNRERYDDTQRAVPGALVMAQAHASSARALYDTLFETLISSSFINKVSPSDTIGAFSYIHSVREHPGNLEEAVLDTFAVKNLDVQRQLKDYAFPKALFANEETLRPAEYEAIVKDTPLSGNIVSVSRRSIFRPATTEFQMFLL